MNIRKELLDIDINIIDDEISKLHTRTIKLFKERVELAYMSAKKDRNAMKQLEDMNKKLETLILNDEIEFNNHCKAVIKCSKEISESIF